MSSPTSSPYVTLISSVIGTDGDPVYDTLVSVPPAVCEAAVFIHSVLEEYAESGRPLWPPVPGCGRAGRPTRTGWHRGGKKVLEERSEACLLVGGDGDGAEE